MKEKLKANVEFCLYVRRFRYANSRCKGLKGLYKKGFIPYVSLVGRKGGGVLLPMTFPCAVVQSNFSASSETSEN